MDKEIEITDKFWDELDESYHNVWYAFLDKWFPNSIANYRGSYTITHPWIIIEYWKEEFIFAWQRIFRGWDDRIIWSIDYYLAKMLPLWLEKLKQDKHGVPNIFFKKEDEYVDSDGILTIKEEAMIRAEKEFDNVLDKISNGFKAYKRIQDECLYPEKDKKLYYQFNKEFENGMDLLKKYFGTLWD